MEVTQYYVVQNIDLKHNVTAVHKTPHITQETTKCQKYEVPTEKKEGERKREREREEYVLTKFNNIWNQF
jgi:hypothetical protein